MKYKVVGEEPALVNGEVYQPGEEFLIAPLHAQALVEKGVLEVVPVQRSQPKKSKQAPPPEPAE